MAIKGIARTLVAGAAGMVAVAVFAAGGAGGDIEKVDPSVHFHPKGKPPSEHTLKVLNEARESMPFEDTRDFDEARKGFIAPLKSGVVMADAGHVAWDVDRYDFLKAEEGWPSVHPSTQRQGHLNQITGLFEVGDGIYQVRGFDLSDITFVRGATGWIVIDIGTVRETARAAPWMSRYRACSPSIKSSSPSCWRNMWNSIRVLPYPTASLTALWRLRKAVSGKSCCRPT